MTDKNNKRCHDQFPPSDMTADINEDVLSPLSPSNSVESITASEKIELLQATILEINSKLGDLKSENEHLTNQNKKLTKDYDELTKHVLKLEVKLKNKENLSDTDTDPMNIDEEANELSRRTKRKLSPPTPKSQVKIKKTFNFQTKTPTEGCSATASNNQTPSTSTNFNSPKQVSPQPGTSKDKTDETTLTTPHSKIPPIVVHNKDKWTTISTYFKNNQINFNSAKNSDDGIKISMTDIDSYRKGTKFLELQKFEFHTYQLQDEKLLHIVIRGLPTEINIDDIKRELENRNYHPTSVRRMMQKRPVERPLPLVVILLPREEKSIYNLTDLLDLRVKIETLKSKPSLTQCFNCQRFGHAQSKCKAQPKCLKCGSGHPTYTCAKTQATPAKCANCGGAHPANFSGCPSRPPKPQERPQVVATRISGGSTATYASAAKANTESNIAPSPNQLMLSSSPLNPQAVIHSLIQSFVTQLNTFAQRFASSLEPAQLKL